MTPGEIARDLRRDILQGRYAPGQDLPQADLAARFRVSRIPVRDALALLAFDRLVEQRPNRSARVARLSRAELAEVQELRLILESEALRRALPNLTPEALARIDAAAQACEIAADTPHFPKADWRFHEAIYAAAGRPRLLSLIRDLRQLCQIHVAAYPRLRTEAARWSADHRAILTALQAGAGGEAAVALEAHLSASAASLAQAMDAGGAG